MISVSTQIPNNQLASHQNLDSLTFPETILIHSRSHLYRISPSSFWVQISDGSQLGISFIRCNRSSCPPVQIGDGQWGSYRFMRHIRSLPGGSVSPYVIFIVPPNFNPEGYGKHSIMSVPESRKK